MFTTIDWFCALNFKKSSIIVNYHRVRFINRRNYTCGERSVNLLFIHSSLE